MEEEILLALGMGRGGGRGGRGRGIFKVEGGAFGGVVGVVVVIVYVWGFVKGSVIVRGKSGADGNEVIGGGRGKESERNTIRVSLAKISPRESRHSDVPVGCLAFVYIFTLVGWDRIIFASMHMPRSPCSEKHLNPYHYKHGSHGDEPCHGCVSMAPKRGQAGFCEGDKGGG